MSRAFPSGAPFRCCPLEKAPGLAHKHQAWPERLDRSTHSHLFGPLVNYGCKKFRSISPMPYFNSLFKSNTNSSLSDWLYNIVYYYYRNHGKLIYFLLGIFSMKSKHSIGIGQFSELLSRSGILVLRLNNVPQ